jgi:hypothetical protein
LRRLSRLLFVWGCACLALCAIAPQPAHADPGKNILAPGWVYMPAGTRATYIGIHGGTVPVSLLTSRDGTHMVALVGQTGNDFLRTLKVDPGTRGALLPTAPVAQSPSDGEEDAGSAYLPLQAPTAPAPPSFRLAANATLLMASTAVGAMPVIYATGHSFANLNQLYTDSLLFGLSENSPLLEGAVKAPLKAKDIRAAKRRPLVHGSATP